MVKGLDNGYHFTKDNEGKIFKSAFERVDRSLSEQNKIIIDGSTYYFGRGSITSDEDKIDTEINKVCTLANLAMTGSGEYCLVVGLPINQYAANNERFRDTIMSYNNSEVIYNKQRMNIYIADVTVFAQGAGALFYCPLPDGEYIIIDVGSYTINVVYAELANQQPSIIKFNTWFNGILTLYQDIVDYANSKYSTTYDVLYGKQLIENGLCIKGIKYDSTYIETMKLDYIENFLSNFKRAYSMYTSTPILICGGGGEMFQMLMGNKLGNTILMPDSQFVNAVGYYNFGLQKYARKEVIY